VSGLIVSGVPSSASVAHEASHEPGGSDALPWVTKVHGAGTTAARPAAAAGNAGFTYFATDSGITWRSDGAVWVAWSWDAEWLLNGGPGVLNRTPYPRHGVRADLALLASGTQTLVAVPMLKGDVMTSITFFAGATALGTPTHWWFSLYDSALNKVGQTADQVAAAWAANTAKTLPLAGGPFTAALSGVYYVGICCVGAVTPSLRAANVQHSIVNLGIAGQAPLGVDSGAGLTNVAPAAITLVTSNIQLPYCVVS
jgi:hypothetical protein